MSLVIFVTKTFITIAALYKSLQAFKQDNTQELLSFWLIYGIFVVFEGFYFNVFIPFYDYIKLAFLSWLLFSGGNKQFCSKFILPHLNQIEQIVEDSDARNQVANATKQFILKIIRKISNLIE